jgi:SNF2 family DNA or RNA helicase
MTVVVSKPNRALLVPSSGAVRALFPDAPVLRGNVVVPHDIRNHVLLNRIGLRQPNPMLLYYDWHGGVPFAVQRATCAMLTTETHAYVLNDYGTGKTKAALWAWDYLNRNNYCGKLLVCATLSTLQMWAGETFATLRGRKVAVLHGTRAERLRRLADPEVDIYVINHDGTNTIFDDIVARTDIDALVIDELATYRNSNGRSKAMVKLAKRMTWVWGLTGAPMPNEPVDVWMQGKIVTPRTVPMFQKQAREMLMKKISNYRWVAKPDAIENAFRMLQPSVRFALDSVVELPQRIERTINIPLAGDHKDTYEQIVKHMQAMVQGKKITAANAGAAMSKLLQIAGGWVYGGGHEVINLTPQGNNRIDILMEIIQESTHKVIVFVPFRHAIAGLSEWMTKAKIDLASVHGDTKHRDRIFNAFQNTEQYKVILAHPRCMAHGLTLTAANVIVWYCPITSLELYDQANARIRRYGQTHKQIILHLSGTPVESKIYSLLRRKQRIQDQLLEMLEAATSMEEAT